MAGQKRPRVGIGVMVFKVDNLPKPLFEAIEQTLEALNSGKNFFDE